MPFFSRFYAFSRISPTFLIGEWLFSSVERSNGYVGHLGPCLAIYYQRWLNVADPTSLDVLVLIRITAIFVFSVLFCKLAHLEE